MTASPQNLCLSNEFKESIRGHIITFRKKYPLGLTRIQNCTVDQTAIILCTLFSSILVCGVVASDPELLAPSCGFKFTSYQFLRLGTESINSSVHFTQVLNLVYTVAEASSIVDALPLLTMNNEFEKDLSVVFQTSRSLCHLECAYSVQLVSLGSLH